MIHYHKGLASTAPPLEEGFRTTYYLIQHHEATFIIWGWDYKHQSGHNGAHLAPLFITVKKIRSQKSPLSLRKNSQLQVISECQCKIQELTLKTEEEKTFFLLFKKNYQKLMLAKFILIFYLDFFSPNLKQAWSTGRGIRIMVRQSNLKLVCLPVKQITSNNSLQNSVSLT